MILKLEENELLAALLTAQMLSTHLFRPSTPFLPEVAREWRETYQGVLREFIELNKAEMTEK